MTTEELLERRWAAHRLSLPPSADPVAAVAHHGALQAQDEGAVLLAAALRTKGANPAAVAADLEAGRLVRAHVLRPTWHLVAAADLGWLREATGPRIRRALAPVFRQAGVDEGALERALGVIVDATDRGPVGKDDVVEVWAARGLPVWSPVAGHYLMEAEARLAQTYLRGHGPAAGPRFQPGPGSRPSMNTWWGTPTAGPWSTPKTQPR